jgi:drug/metabolite transporter (DMT)-like permease
LNSPATAASASPPSVDSSTTSSRPNTLVLFLMLVLMLFLWSMNYVAGKIALNHLDPVSLACFRIELAALIMLPIYLLRGQRAKLRARDLWPFAYLGFFGVVMNQGLFTVGLNYTTSGRSSVVIAVGPIIILLLARAMKLEALTPGKIIGMAVAFAGVFLLETEQGSPSRSPFLFGDMVTLGGTIGFSIYTVLGKRVAAQYDAISMNTFNCVAAALMLLPLALRQSLNLDWKAVGWVGWTGMAYMAVGSSVAAYTLFYWLLRYMTASRIAAVSYFQPIAVLLLAVAFLGEHPTRNLLLCTALVLIGVYLAERGTG